MEKGAAAYRGYRDLKVYQLSYRTALEIHEITKTFPREEKYSLTDQIRRSSRSVPTNIAEGWKKRRYKKLFISKIIDSAGEAGETEVWVNFSLDFGYIDVSCHKDLLGKYAEINRMLNGMIEKADSFCRVR